MLAVARNTGSVVVTDDSREKSVGTVLSEGEALLVVLGRSEIPNDGAKEVANSENAVGVGGETIALVRVLSLSRGTGYVRDNADFVLDRNASGEDGRSENEWNSELDQHNVE